MDAEKKKAMMKKLGWIGLTVGCVVGGLALYEFALRPQIVKRLPS